MTSTREAERAVRETVEALGGLDIVVANAVGVCEVEGVWG